MPHNPSSELFRDRRRHYRGKTSAPLCRAPGGTRSLKAVRDTARDERIAHPAPAPDMVTASRRHLTTGYASGVDRLLWDMDKRPMPDMDAVHAVISADQAHHRADALDIGAALILLLEMRLQLDCLEADVLDVALDSGLSPESLAAVLELPDPVLMRHRLEYLAARRELLRGTAHSAPPRKSQKKQKNLSDGSAARAAEQAARRAELASDRAASAARRREELRTGERPSGRADADKATARASEARIQASDAAERVASGLLRAADALEGCAEKSLAGDGAEQDPAIRQRAQAYASAAQRYREMATAYLDIGKRM